MGQKTPQYRPISPEKAVLYQLFADHKEKFLSESESKLAPNRGYLRPEASEAPDKNLIPLSAKTGV